MSALGSERLVTKRFRPSGELDPATTAVRTHCNDLGLLPDPKGAFFDTTLAWSPSALGPAVYTEHETTLARIEQASSIWRLSSADRLASVEAACIGTTARAFTRPPTSLLADPRCWQELREKSNDSLQHDHPGEESSPVSGGLHQRKWILHRRRRSGRSDSGAADADRPRSGRGSSRSWSRMRRPACRCRGSIFRAPTCNARSRRNMQARRWPSPRRNAGIGTKQKVSIISSELKHPAPRQGVAIDLHRASRRNELRTAVIHGGRSPASPRHRRRWRGRLETAAPSMTNIT